jgi:hypothetical protein
VSAADGRRMPVYLSEWEIECCTSLSFDEDFSWGLCISDASQSATFDEVALRGKVLNGTDGSPYLSTEFGCFAPNHDTVLAPAMDGVVWADRHQHPKDVPLSRVRIELIEVVSHVLVRGPSGLYHRDPLEPYRTRLIELDHHWLAPRARVGEPPRYRQLDDGLVARRMPPPEDRTRDRIFIEVAAKLSVRVWTS